METIRAAGVVLTRPAPSGPEVLLVHRVRRRDWSLPKGKLEPGEDHVAAAARECAEETGVSPTLGPRLPTLRYEVMGRRKSVHYWAATVGADLGHPPDDEVDEVRWVPLAEVPRVATYPADAALVDLAASLPATSPLVVLRHAQAVKRALWAGAEALRPLTTRGRAQADALVGVLAAFGVRRVHSSAAARCHDTVRPFAEAVRATVEDEPLLGEEAHAAAPHRVPDRVRALAGQPEPLVVCTHRPVLPAVMATLAGLAGADSAGHDARGLDPAMPPGTLVVLHRAFDGGPGAAPRLVAVERHTR